MPSSKTLPSFRLSPIVALASVVEDGRRAWREQVRLVTDKGQDEVQRLVVRRTS